MTFDFRFEIYQDFSDVGKHPRKTCETTTRIESVWFQHSLKRRPVPSFGTYKMVDDDDDKLEFNAIWCRNIKKIYVYRDNEPVIVTIIQESRYNCFYFLIIDVYHYYDLFPASKNNKTFHSWLYFLKSTIISVLMC